MIPSARQATLTRPTSSESSIWRALPRSVAEHLGAGRLVRVEAVGRRLDAAVADLVELVDLPARAAAPVGREHDATNARTAPSRSLTKR